MNRENKKLVVLDIDKTLLHISDRTEFEFSLVMARAVNPFFKHEGNFEEYERQILARFINSYRWDGCVVCPRPYLEEFIKYLLSQNIDIGIYSTLIDSYLLEILLKNCTDLIENSLFIWGRNITNKFYQGEVKDITAVSKLFNYPIGSILMIDSRLRTKPFQNLVPIMPYDVNPPHFEEALLDKELLTMIKRLEVLLNIPDIHQRRNLVSTEMRKSSMEYAKWRLGNKYEIDKE